MYPLKYIYILLLLILNVTVVGVDAVRSLTVFIEIRFPTYNVVSLLHDMK